MRCTGHCCRRMYLPFTKERMERLALAVEASSWAGRGLEVDGQRPPPESDYRVPFLLIHLEDAALPAGEAGGYYGCRVFEEETGRCGDYANRPRMCRAYPYGEKCTYAGCTLTDLVPLGRAGTAAVPVLLAAALALPDGLVDF